MIEVTVAHLGLDRSTNTPVVILREKEGARVLPIWIGPAEASAIAMELQGMKAQRPLKEARIDVMEIPGKPGAYRAVAFMRPHFQLDELSMSMRLVAGLPPPAK